MRQSLALAVLTIKGRPLPEHDDRNRAFAFSARLVVATINGQVLLDVQDLKMYFPVTSGALFQRHVADIKAVDGVSVTLARGETLGY